MTIFKRLLPLVPLLVLLLSSSASAATAGPGWTVESFASPTSFSAAQNADCIVDIGKGVGVPRCDAYQVTARNAGQQATNGERVTLTDTVPAGLTVQESQFFSEAAGAGKPTLVPGACTPTPVVSPVGRVSCVYEGLVEPDQTLWMIVRVTVADPTASEPLSNTASVFGGGASEAVTDPVTSPPNDVGGPAPGFGFSSFDFYVDGVDGMRDTQAGDHPYELTTTIDLNSVIRVAPDGTDEDVTSVHDVKDVVVDLPLGFVGSILAAPQCTFAQLSSHVEAGVGGCPADTIVGQILTEPANGVSVDGHIYNMTPEHGVPAEFAYIDESGGAHVFYVHVVPTPQGYVLQTINPDIPEISLDHIIVTFYGDPAERDGTGNAKVPFFTNPTGCANGPLRAQIWMDSWTDPGAMNPDGTPNLTDKAWVSGEHGVSESPAVTGCNSLQFTPELGAQPTTHEADTPSGLEFEIKQPQPEEAGTLATSTLNTATVVLPEGMTVDPSAGDGLQACSEAQIGWLGAEAPNGEPLPNNGLANFSPGLPECPEASKIGSLELSTPLIPNKLEGALYLASQNENPFGSVLAGYVVVDDPVTGVLIKIAGELKANPQTGQITGIFKENPQLPFSDLKLHFFGGPRGSLATPESCGTFTTTSVLEPWSFPGSGPSATPFDAFSINSGCVSGFAPSFTALSTNVQAGAYTPFDLSFSREDTDQQLAGLTDTFPPGLLAKLAGVPLCSNSDASAGTCPAGSQIGTVQAEAGPGPNPLQQTGKVYLTGPYKGAPYGESVVVPALAGPYNFGLVVVRGAIYVDPHTAQATVVSDPFPTMLDVTGANGQTAGIPIRLRRVDVHIDRPEFTFNPTNCSKLQATGSITSTQGQSSALATPFQVTNCQTLKFQPKFSVSTAGKTSRADGASLNVKLTYPKTAQGVEANIARVKVDLPKQLPSRLTTLQKACTAKQFDANPANCPKESKIGYATVHTPILPLPLSGPAIFVSHGGEAFPSLIMVLQGNGVTLDLVGTTFISKAGITSSTFKTVPDAPVGSFELSLPVGKFSALAANLPAKANHSFCGQTLKMPTEFLAQNGAKINESTAIGVTGCAKAKALTRAQKLTKALKVCRKDHEKSKRQQCEALAGSKYGAVKQKRK